MKRIILSLMILSLVLLVGCTQTIVQSNDVNEAQVDENNEMDATSKNDEVLKDSSQDAKDDKAEVKLSTCMDYCSYYYKEYDWRTKADEFSEERYQQDLERCNTQCNRDSPSTYYKKMVTCLQPSFDACYDDCLNACSSTGTSPHGSTWVCEGDTVNRKCAGECEEECEGR